MKIIDKFRKWLIKKLGGYIKSETIPPTIIKTVTVQPIKVCIDTNMNPFELSSPEYKEYIIKSACERIGDYLYGKKLCTVDICRDEILNEEIAKVSLWVMPPDWNKIV